MSVYEKTFTLKDEDHTMGNAVRYMLNKNPQVSLAGYSVPHPMEKSVNVRVQTTGEVTATAAMFVGCVAFAAARNNDKAGLITFAEEIERYVPAKKGRNHVLRLIREACETPLPQQSTDFKKALDYAGRVQRKHAIVFVVSDFLGADCERELRLLSRRS